MLAAENDRLKGKRESNFMLIGGGLVGLGRFDRHHHSLDEAHPQK